MTKTVYCGSCPAFTTGGVRNMKCGLTEYVVRDRGMFEYYQDEPDCPLKRLELKDGFVFVPEVVSE